MAAYLSYQVVDWSAGAMAAALSSLTPAGGWTPDASRPSPRAISDAVPDGTVVETDAAFAERCGWTFDHWRITEEDLTDGTRTVRTSQNNPLRHSLAFAGDSHWYSVTFEAFGFYNGTGKVMVSYLDRSKVIRTAGAPVKIFVDQ